MAYVDIVTTWPSLNIRGAATYTCTLDASGEKFAWIFRVPKDGTLNSVGFLLGTVAQAPTNGLKVSFQDVDATTGAPDGNVDQYATVTSGLTSDTWVDVSATGYMGSTGAGSGTKRSVTAGEIIAVVIEFASFSASDSVIITGPTSTGAPANNNSSYYAYNTGAWTKAGGLVGASLKYDDGTYAVIEGTWPISAATSTTINNGSTPDEVGNIFQLPFACKVSGAFAYLDADGDCDIILYDSDGTTVLGSYSLDKDCRMGSTNSGAIQSFTQGVITLAANTQYRLAIKPTSATNISYPHATFPSTAVMAQTEMGTNAYWTECTDGGSWSETTTKLLAGLGVIISQIDIPAGGGGGLPILGGSVVR